MTRSAPSSSEETVEELYEHAPCGYLSTDPSGLIVRVNETFLEWTGHKREDIVGARRFPDLLSAGGRIYHETHYAPLLRMQGAVREIAVDIRRADGTLLPALINSVMKTDDAGRPTVVRTTIFDATDRRRYEDELLEARRRGEHVVEELQRSLLSGVLPEDPRLELAVEYQAAAPGLDVGGDWYDAFWLRAPDRLALVVGDVVGRGIGAAATMGQLRSAVRALAATGLGPAALLDALDQFARRHDVGLNTTLVYAELDLADGRLRWACAGHPPPLLLEPDADACMLWGGRSAPLDSYVGEAPPRAECETTLDPGGLLMLYTDGLVERRNATIDDGMNRLLEEVQARAEEPLGGLAGAIFRILRDADHPDDVCVLAVRRLSPLREA